MTLLQDILIGAAILYAGWRISRALFVTAVWDIIPGPPSRSYLAGMFAGPVRRRALIVSHNVHRKYGRDIWSRTLGTYSCVRREIWPVVQGPWAASGTMSYQLRRSGHDHKHLLIGNVGEMAIHLRP